MKDLEKVISKIESFAEEAYRTPETLIFFRPQWASNSDDVRAMRDDFAKYLAETCNHESNQLFDVGVRLLLEGYPAIDCYGAISVVDVISSMLADMGYDMRSSSQLMPQGLDDASIASLDVCMFAAEKTLDSNEVIRIVEHGNLRATPMMGKSKFPSLILTDKRVLFVGHDVPEIELLYMGASAGMMIYPGVSTNVNISGHRRSMFFPYENFPDSYCPTIDYIAYNDIEKIKSKKNRIIIGMSKQFRLLEIPHETLNPLHNRPIPPNSDFESARPILSREFEFTISPSEYSKESAKTIASGINSEIRR